MRPLPLLLPFVVPFVVTVSAAAQEPYRLPPAEVVDIVTAPPAPSVQLSPDGRWMMLSERDAMPSLADVSRRMLRLAGMRIDPAADARFSTGFAKNLAIRPTDGGDPLPVALPDGAKVAGASWSHDSSHFVVTVVTEAGSELWGGTADAPQEVRRLVENLSTVTGGPTWLSDGVRVLCRRVPSERGEEPPEPGLPSGPNVQSTSGEESPTRTYQDLLANPHDEALFEHYAISELVLVAVDDGATQTLGVGLTTQVSTSPDGRWLLETRVHRPYSYLMPAYQFPHTVRVRPLDGEGQPMLIAEVPLAENIPIGGVRTGPRSFTWKASEPATLMWAEALDGGDPDQEVPHRDRWLALGPPFERERASEVLRVEHRAWGLTFLADPALVITSEYDRDRRWVRSLLHEPRAASSPKVLEDRSRNDRYGDPGRIVTEPGPFGRSVVRTDGPWIYRSGQGATSQGSLPFLVRQNLETLASEELWRCTPGSYESVVAVLPVLPVLPGGGTAFLTRHETPSSPPNYRRREVGAETFVALTDFPDPTPQIRGITKKLVHYERADGVPLSATLYLPANYEQGTRLPLALWAYPREFNDVRTAGQVGGSPWRFTRIAGSDHKVLLTQGYALMDGATMPIIGDPETMNDTFREQLVSSAAAAIAYAADLGVADPARVGVGGHSYGAFMTANLLAHSDLFRAGVARSGAYNRTLTPFGFQSERRTLWEAPETYFAVSPFMHAHEIDAPMLMIHGEADNNSGTFPVQSKRMFQAIKGNGGTARLVMLPNESHGYRAEESVLHVLAEMIDWFDLHVKPPLRTVEASFEEDR